MQHLAAGEREHPEALAFWAIDRVPPGANVVRERLQALEAARVALVLVSVALFDAPVLRPLLDALVDRAAAQRVTLIPVFLRPCNADRVSFGAQRLPLTTFQSVHSPDRPLSRLGH